MTVFAAEWPKVLARVRAARSPSSSILRCGADSLDGDPITHMRFSPATHGRAAADLAQLAERLGRGRVLALGGRRVQPHESGAGVECGLRGIAGLSGLLP